MTESMHGLAKSYMRKWRLIPDGQVIQTPTSSLFPAVRGGEPLMLKIIKEDGDEQNSCTALRHYHGRGAVKVFEHTDDAFVMQRAAAGSTLVAFRQEHGDAKATDIVADVLTKLHGAAVPKTLPNLPKLNVLRSAFAAVQEIDQPVLSQPLLAFAEALFDKLIASSGLQTVLHGDLHHENVLFDLDCGWLAIDPKGFIGDPIYDCSALFKNPLNDQEVADERCILSRVKILQARLGYPFERILEWAFVHCVLSVIWSLQDGMPVGPALPVALMLFEILQAD